MPRVEDFAASARTSPIAVQAMLPFLTQGKIDTGNA
jgi:hypothetical protein